MQPKYTEVDETCYDENGKIPYLVSHIPASQALVDMVLSAPEGDPDGRSEWRWFRLANGDLILGVFPCGDTYFEVEHEASF